MPREVRRQLGLSAGDRVEFLVEGEQIIFRRSPSVANVFDKASEGQP